MKKAEDKKAEDAEKSKSLVSKDEAKVSTPVEPPSSAEAKREAVRLGVERAKELADIQKLEKEVDRVRALEQSGANLTTTDKVTLVIADQAMVNKSYQEQLQKQSMTIQQLMDLMGPLALNVAKMVADRAANDSNSELIKEQERQSQVELARIEAERLAAEIAAEEEAAAAKKFETDVKRREVGAHRKAEAAARARAARQADSSASGHPDDTAGSGAMQNLLRSSTNLHDSNESDGDSDSSRTYHGKREQMTMESFAESAINASNASRARSTGRQRFSRQDRGQDRREERRRGSAQNDDDYNWSEQDEANSPLRSDEYQAPRRSRSLGASERQSYRSGFSFDRDRGIKFANHKSVEQQFDFAMESFKREQDNVRKASLMESKTSKQRAAIYGNCKFGRIEDSMLLRKALDMARVNALLAQQNRVEGVLLVAKVANFPMLTRINAYTHARRMVRAIEHDGVVPNEPCKPGKFVQETCLRLLVNRLQTLQRHKDILQNLGLAAINIPTVELLQTMNKDEYHFNVSLSLVPHDTAEAEEMWLDIFESQELGLQIYPGEEAGLADMDRIEELVTEKFKLTLGTLSDFMPQWSVLPGEDGNLKTMPNFPGIFKTKESLDEGMNSLFYSGYAFQAPPTLTNGKPDPKAKTLKRAIAKDMAKAFVPSKDMRRMGVDIAHDLGLAAACFESWNEARKAKPSFAGVLGTQVFGKVQMMHERVAHNRRHPSKLEVEPVPSSALKSAPAFTQRSAQQKYPFAHKGAVSTDKLEEARQEMAARSRGESPKSPPFWSSPSKRDNGTLRGIPLQHQRTGLLHILAQMRNVVDDRRALAQEDQWLAEEDARLLDDLEQDEDAGYESAKEYADDGDVRYRDDEDQWRHDVEDAIGRAQDTGQDTRDTREYYADVKQDVLQQLCNMEPSLLRKLPQPLQERVSEFRADRSEREAHRNDSTYSQRDRNSANNNPGRLYEADRRKVGFASGGAYANRVCLKHQRGQCPHANNPQDCMWSHDPDVCSADADTVARVAAERALLAKKTRKPTTEKAAVAATIGANNRQQMEQKQSSALPRHSSSSDDTQEEG
jgi:hypothetical protein